jgi:hypothetical protein
VEARLAGDSVCEIAIAGKLLKIFMATLKL